MRVAEVVGLLGVIGHTGGGPPAANSRPVSNGSADNGFGSGFGTITCVWAGWCRAA